MSRDLGVPADICNRPPTTDTYSLPQSQEEFYFSLPWDRMDLCLWARRHDVSPAEAAPVVGLTPAQIERVFRDIDSKAVFAEYLHCPPLALAPA
jgi:NAD+ synthase